MIQEAKTKNLHEGHRKRMKQQFLVGGIDQFQPHQVLEMLLFYAIPQKDTNPLAHRLLDTFGDLPSVLEADVEDLCRVDGVSIHVATMLNFCGQLLSRYHKEKGERVTISTLASIKEYLSTMFVNETCEKVRLVSMNNRQQLLNCSVVHVGTPTVAEISIREMIQTALRYKATAVIIAHNHPAGYCTPSPEDLTMTRDMISAFKIVGITVVDHIICADNGSFSMRESPYYAPLFSEDVWRKDKCIRGNDV